MGALLMCLPTIYYTIIYFRLFLLSPLIKDREYFPVTGSNKDSNKLSQGDQEDLHTP